MSVIIIGNVKGSGPAFLFRKRIDVLKTDRSTRPLDKLPPILRQDLDKNLCVCMDVPEIDIINAIANGATTLEAIKKQTYAAMGSGCCVQQIERLIECLCAPEPVNRRHRRKNYRDRPG